MRNRLDRARARADTRQWVQDRRARTRHLIELGGLVQKAGLVELADDDRATLLGAFLELAARLQEQEGETLADLRARWRRRGLRAFDADKNGAAAMSATKEGDQPGAETG
ncbi:MAG: conjugal transfer protein TraD [Acetobacteraceae bacterium]